MSELDDLTRMDSDDMLCEREPESGHEYQVHSIFRRSCEPGETIWVGDEVSIRVTTATTVVIRQRSRHSIRVV